MQQRHSWANKVWNHEIFMSKFPITNSKPYQFKHGTIYNLVLCQPPIITHFLWFFNILFIWYSGKEIGLCDVREVDKALYYPIRQNTDVYQGNNHITQQGIHNHPIVVIGWVTYQVNTEFNIRLKLSGIKRVWRLLNLEYTWRYGIRGVSISNFFFIEDLKISKVNGAP